MGAAGCCTAAAAPRAVPARWRGALGAAGSGRTRPAAAGSAGTARCGTGPYPAGGGGAGGSRQPPGKRVSNAAVPRLPRVWVGAGAERGPRQRRRQRSGKPRQPFRGRAERPGHRDRRLSDRGSHPARSAPFLPRLGAAAFPSPSPSPSSTGPPRGQGACPGNRVPRGKKRFPFRHPPKQPAGDGVWLPCPWGCHPTTGAATTYCPRHLPVSVPAFSECGLPPCPASGMFLYACTASGVPAPQGTPPGSPPRSWGSWACATVHLPARTTTTPFTSCRPFVPVAGHSPMTLSICRLTAGSLPSPLAPFPMQVLSPQAPFPGCPRCDLAQHRGPGCILSPRHGPRLVCRSLTSCAGRREVKLQTEQRL